MNFVIGDALEELRKLPGGFAQTCVTSPPYWRLRDYGHAEQIGLEETPDAYVARLVAVFAEVRRVLRADGTLWLNLGDSYAGGGAGEQGVTGQMADRSVAKQRCRTARPGAVPGGGGQQGGARNRNGLGRVDGLKSKDLVGIPWRVAFALQADGWYLRSDIIWAKPNPMPESVTDRPTKAHEYLFLLSKSERYFYDAAAVAEPDAGAPSGNNFAGRQGGSRALPMTGGTGTPEIWEPTGKRNRRTVWTVATQPYDGAHFATMPPKLVEPCIMAGAPLGGLVLDPFLGSGTTGMVAEALGRRWFGIELNSDFAPLIRERTRQVGLFGRGVG